MAITGLSGPLMVFGQAVVPPGRQVGVAQDYNPHRGPSLFDQGSGIMDPRYPYAYNPGGTTVRTFGWWGMENVTIVDQVPSTIATASIAALQIPVAGTALGLVATTAAGITVGASVTNAANGRLVSGLLAIDGAMTPISYGAQGGTNIWDPTKALARAVQITSVGNDATATFLVSGYDVYGYPMSERITGAAVGLAVGKKAFKYIASIVPAGTVSGANVSVGQSDVIGFMLRTDSFAYLKISYPSPTLISAATGFVAAVTTDPATTTTGDVRGTYALQTPSNNANRIIILATLNIANVSSSAGLVGVTQA